MIGIFALLFLHFECNISVKTLTTENAEYNALIMALVSDASVLLTTLSLFNVRLFLTIGQHAPSGVAVKTMYPPELLPDGRLAKDASLKQTSYILP